MPVVRASRQVQTGALPGARRTAAETALSQGAGVEEARAETSRSIAGIGNAIARPGYSIFARDAAETRRLQEEERRRADDLAVLAAENRLAEWERNRLYDPQQGALTVKGKDSFTLPETIEDEFGKLAGEVEQGLQTPEQRAAFARVRAQRQNQVGLSIRRHVYGEMQTYRANELKARVDNAQSLAVANALDPRRAAAELQRGVDAITLEAPRLGFGPEQIANQVASLRSNVHVGTIERMIENDQAGAARIYFEEAKGQISGDRLADVEKALDAGTLKANAQKESDRILAAGGTLTSQREQARQIQDPDLRDAVMQRIEHEAAVQERIDRDTHEARLKGVYDILDRTPNVANIPATEWSRMSGAERASARAYAEHKAKGTPIDTDLPTYYSLMQKAAEDPEAFASENLLRYRGKLHETEFKQLAGMQVSIRNGERRTDDVEAYSTFTQIFNDTLQGAGFDPDDAGALALRRRFEQMAETEARLAGKKKLTNTEIQEVLDRLVMQVTTEKGSLWNIIPGGEPFFDVTKRGFDLTIDDVPAAQRPQIVDALRRRNIPITNDTILDTYLRYVQRNQGQ
jgi:hypothetical protein